MQSQATTPIAVESLNKLVILLKDKNSKFVEEFNGGQYKYILGNSDKSQRPFIALDNVWEASVMEAKTILEALSLHEESLVIVTARNEHTFKMLGIHGDACLEMPELGEEDAMKLFLYHAACGRQFGSEDEKRDIVECIKRSYFEKGGGIGGHYHPLALQSLGVQVSFVGEKPSEWVRNLSRSFKFMGGGNPVFNILRSSFDMLESNEQSLFMDLVVYRPFLEYDIEGCNFEYVVDISSESFEFAIEESGDNSRWVDMVKWLCLVHEVNEDMIKSKLDSVKGKGLKQKGLLLDVDWTFGRISVHDLYMEFAELESKGMLNESLEVENRRFIVSRMSDLRKRPSGGRWHNLSRVGILSKWDEIVSLKRIKWQYFSKLMLELE